MRLFADKIGIVVFFGNLFQVFPGIDNHKGDMIGPKLLGYLYRKIIVIADNKMLLKPCDFIKHTALLGNFLKFSSFDHFNNNTYGNREDDKPKDDQADCEDTSCIRNWVDLSKTDCCEGDSRLIDGIHKRKVIDEHIAQCTDKHRKYGKNKRKSKWR